MAELKTKTNTPADDFMRIEELFFLCLSHWKWFVLSLIIAFSAATLHLLRTPEVYTRSASIMIKKNYKGNSANSEFDNFANMGLFQYSTNVENELLVLQSPATMYEVVKRLQLDMNYYVPRRFQDQTLYGEKLPVKVSIEGLKENESASFTMQISKTGDVHLTNLARRGKVYETSTDIKGKLAENISTPIGDIVITPTPFYVTGFDFTIQVVRTSLTGTANAYASRLSAALNGEKSTVIDLFLRDVSPQRAEDVLRTLIDVYGENWVKDRNQVAISTSKFIDERLAVIESELGNVDKDISSFKSENLMPNVQAASSMYMAKSEKTDAEIMTLNNQLYMTRYIRDYLTNEANANQLLPANSGIGSNNVESQIGEYNAKLLERNNLVANSSTENPLVKDLDQILVDIRKAIIVSVDNQITALNTQIKSLQQSARQTTSRIAANPSQAKYLLSVGRQQKVKEALYLFLLQKREENELSQAFTAYNTRVITPPRGSMAPTSPVRNKIYMMALAMGLLIPIAILFLKEKMNTKVRGRKDLNILTIPFIGEIPLFKKKKKRFFAKKEKDTKAIVVKEGSRDIINEAFRVLRTNLEFMTGSAKENEKQSNVIIITSFNPGSGKSFLSMNIAISLAIKNKKVLLIDGDFRHASSSAYINSPKKGLSNYLSGQEDNVEKIIVTNKVYEQLHILPVGTIPPNPTELLATDKMKMVIDTLKGNYDYVLIDCPPIELVADTQILEKLADRTVFVVRADLFERNMLPELESIYTEKKYKNMAIILNGTDGGGSRYGSRYGYRYGYKYGYHYGYGSGYHYGSDKA